MGFDDVKSVQNQPPSVIPSQECGIAAEEGPPDGHGLGGCGVELLARVPTTAADLPLRASPPATVQELLQQQILV